MLLAKEESSSSDGWVRMFLTRIKRSQDYLVSLQWLTILTGQGHISDLLVCGGGGGGGHSFFLS